MRRNLYWMVRYACAYKDGGDWCYVGKEKEQKITGCLLQIECVSTKPGIETLTPRWWYAEVGLWEAIRSWEWAPNEWISMLIKEITDSSLASSAVWGHIEKMVICEPGSGPSSDWIDWHLDLALPASRTVRNKSRSIAVRMDSVDIWLTAGSQFLHLVANVCKSG